MPRFFKRRRFFRRGKGRRKGFRRYGRKRFYRKRGYRRYGKRFRSKRVLIWRRLGDPGVFQEGTTLKHNWGQTIGDGVKIVTARLNLAVDWATWCAAFNYYRIVKCAALWRMGGSKSDFQSRFSMTDATHARLDFGIECPALVSYLDNDGTNAIDTLELVEREASVRKQVLYPGCHQIRYWKPNILKMLYQTPASTAYCHDRKGKWLSTDYPAIPHYGLVWDWQSPPDWPNVTQGNTCRYEYWGLFEFRGTDRGKIVPYMP